MIENAAYISADEVEKKVASASVYAHPNKKGKQIPQGPGDLYASVNKNKGTYYKLYYA